MSPTRLAWAVLAARFGAGAGEVGCPELADTFHGTNGSKVELAINDVTQQVSGHYHEESGAEYPITGMLFDGCYGEVAVNHERLAFALEGQTLSWSNGKVMAKRGSEVEERDIVRIVYFHARHRVAVAVATMLLGAFFANIFGLYLINFPDPDIRMYTFSMMNTVLSVFTSIAINSAIWSFLREQVLEGQGGRGLGIKATWRARIPFGLAYVLFAWFSMSFLCWWGRRDTRWRKGTCKLGAHVIGFAAMSTSDCYLRFYNDEEEERGGDVKQSLLTIVLALGLLLGLKKTAKCVRKRDAWMKDVPARNGVNKSGEFVPGSRGAARAKELNHRTEETIDEAENEAIALVMSFLLSTILVQCILGELPNPERAEEAAHRGHVGILALGGLASAILSWLALKVDNRPKNREKVEHDCVATVSLTVVDSLSNCTSWCFHLASLWTMQLLFKRYSYFDEKLVRVVNAFAMTVIGIGLTLTLDTIADALRGKVEPKQTRAQADEGLDTIADAAEPIEQHLSTEHQLSLGIRTTIDAVGFCIALSWDNAFECAESTTVEFVIENMGFNHPVLVRMGLAFVLVSFSLPAWWCLVMPATFKTRKRFEVEIEAARKLSKMLAKGWEFEDMQEDEQTSPKHNTSYSLLKARTSPQFGKHDGMMGSMLSLELPAKREMSQA